MDFPFAPNRLEALCARRLGDGFFARAARWYGWGIAVSYGVALALDAGATDTLVHRALATLAWIVGGILGLAAARDPADGVPDGVLALAQEHGFSKAELGRARFTTAVRRIGWSTAAPGVLLSLVPYWYAEGAREWAACLLRTLGVVLFATTFGVAVAALARACAALAPGRGRAALLGAVFLPYAAASLWPALPSVPSLFAAWLKWLVVRGHA